MRRAALHHSFPDPLIACIRDGRAPEPDEVTALGLKMCAEGVIFLSADRPEIAERFAQIALLGGDGVMAQVQKKAVQEQVPAADGQVRLPLGQSKRHLKVRFQTAPASS